MPDNQIFFFSSTNLNIGVSEVPTGLDQTEEETKAVRLVDQLFAKSKQWKSQYDEKWLDYYKEFRGVQWLVPRPRFRNAEVINMIFQNIQSMVPIQTDAQPKFEFLPEEPSDRPLAKILNQIAEADWERNNWSMQLLEIVYESYFYGTGMGTVEFRPKEKFGLGRIDFRSRDPFYCFPDPDSYDVNDNSDFFIYAEPVSTSKLKEEFPDKAEFIKPDLIDLMGGDKTTLTKTVFRSPTDDNLVIDKTERFDAERKDRALKVTCWMKDNSFIEEEIEERDPQSGEMTKRKQRRKKFPNGRKIIKTGGVLLFDGPIEEEDGLFPFQRLPNYILPREFWGISEIEQLESPQMIFNKLVSFSLDVLTLMGNPIWVVDTTSEVDTDNLFNSPGLIVEKAPGSEVRREAGTQLQPYVLQLIDRMKVWFDDISGSSEASRGIRPDGVSTGIAITSLQQASQQRIRLKARNMDIFLQQVGSMYASRVFQYYTVPQVFRVTNDDQTEKYFKFHVEPQIDPETGEPIKDEKGDNVKLFRFRPMEQDENGQPIEGEETVLQAQGTFDVRVTTGSTLPFVKDANDAKAFRLFESGAIDDVELLKAIEWPNADSVIERVKERRLEQQQEQLALQQQAAQAAAPQGG